MIKDYFHEKIALILSFLILNNYFLLSLNIPFLLIKINFLLFLFFILIFYFKNFAQNYFLKIFFLFIIFISLGTPTFEWDPRSIWLFHAKRIFYDQSIYTFLDNYAAFSHNDYPLLAPALASTFASLIGHWNEVFPKISFLLMFLPPLILINSFLKNTYYLIFLSIVFFTIGKYLFNGWADGLVAVYFGLSSLLMYVIIIADNDLYKKKLFFSLIAFCFFTSLTLIKNEGIVLLLLLFITTFLIKIYKGDLKKDIKKLFFLFFSFLPIIFWKYLCYSNGIDNDHINTSTLINLISRLDDFEDYKIISYFILLNEKFLISLIFFLIWLKRNNELFIFVFSLSLMYIVVLYIVSLSSTLDIYFILDSTSARVIKSISFLLALFGIYNLKDYKIKY